MVLRTLSPETPRTARWSQFDVYILAAFRQVAREQIGLEPKTLFKAWLAPILAKMQDLPDVEPDPAKVAEHADTLAELWEAETRAV